MKIYEFGLVQQGGNDTPDPNQIELCCRWIRLHARHRKTFNERRSSYGLKHSVESWTEKTGSRREYITNGAFIAAAIVEGYRVKQINTGPNAFFNMGIIEQE